jgi:hypothetical protein
VVANDPASSGLALTFFLTSRQGVWAYFQLSGLLAIFPPALTLITNYHQLSLLIIDTVFVGEKIQCLCYSLTITFQYIGVSSGYRDIQAYYSFDTFLSVSLVPLRSYCLSI